MMTHDESRHHRPPMPRMNPSSSSSDRRHGHGHRPPTRLPTSRTTLRGSATRTRKTFHHPAPVPAPAVRKILLLFLLSRSSSFLVLGEDGRADAPAPAHGADVGVVNNHRAAEAAAPPVDRRELRECRGGDDDVGDDHGTTCPSPAVEDDARLKLSSSCPSGVILFEGLPPPATVAGASNEGGRWTPASVLLYDDALLASSSAVGYAKISRFSPEFETWSSSSEGDGHDQGRVNEEPRRYLHVSANGDHEGWIVSVPTDPISGYVSVACLKLAKRLIAREIVARRPPYRDRHVKEIDLRGPHTLVDEEGRPFDHESLSYDPSSSHVWRLHLLLPRETFVHEAVSEGFIRKLSDGVTTLTTLSMIPRVFVVDPILSKDDCDELIAMAEHNFRRSSEVHYSDQYKNYRTSLSAYVSPNAPASRRLWSCVRDVTGVPREGGVESPQPLKYEVNSSWYKAHMDYYHNFQERPLEEVRMFVRTRATELVRWNVSSEVRDALLDGDGDGGEGEVVARVEESISRFDDITSIMSRSLARRLFEEAGSTIPSGVDPRLILHNRMMRGSSSDDRRGEFSRVAILYASALLESLNGDEDSTEEGRKMQARKLAERYFSSDEIPYASSSSSHDVDVRDYVPYVHKPVQVNNRHATVLPILRSAIRGGHTSFPRSTSRMGLPPEAYAEETIQECTKGLVVKPTAGQALMFYNRLPDGELDPKSEHAGCPPAEGEKYAANCFTWDTDMWWARKFLGRADELYR